MSANISWLGHSSMKLTLADGRVILIDPWLTDNPACPETLQSPDRCDYIFLTHGHADHIGDVHSLVERFDPMVVANYELCGWLEKQFGKGRFSGMNTGGTQVVDGISVSLTQAFHSSSVDSPQGPIYAGMPNGLVIQVDGLASIYHAGDTDVFGDMKLIAEMYQPAICMLPIGDFFTMGARGAAMAANLLKPKAILPIHYKTFPILAQSADEFTEALSEEWKSSVVVAEVGQPLEWTSNGLSAGT